jgi:hypothetical protein
MSRNQSPATAVVHGVRPPTGSRSQVNDCNRKSRTGADDQELTVAKGRHLALRLISLLVETREGRSPK